MAMGRARRRRQGTLFVETGEPLHTPGRPFHEKVSALPEKHGFEAMVEGECARRYSDRTGRPGIPPVVCLKALFAGFCGGADPERGIAWRVADSMALRAFPGCALT